WLQYRSSYLCELLRRKGRGTVEDSSCCPMCHRTRAVMRCRECFGGTLLCGRCCVENHRQHPLHRIEEWTGDSFKKTSLRELGLVMHLGTHNTQSPCVNPSIKTLVVLHTNGLHSVAVNFCGCRHNLAGYQQLLQASWYPATPLNPETCVTIELLELFHLLNLQGNTTIYDFVKVMEMTTDGWLLERIPDRQQSFTTVVQEWRHLCMLMRAGRGHEPDGIPTTKPGELAVQCRACPHPGYNLPDNFRDVPKGHSYLYWQTVAVDCNFRLKNRYRHSNNLDVTLSHGWAYFVEQKGYLEYVKRHANQQEVRMSTCAGFQAMLQANLKKAKGLNATGVVGVACSRHELWRPNGMGDLQRGERCCNVDYVLVAALLGVTLRLLIMYDIACQYFKLFWTRMLGLPAGMRLAIPSIKQVVTKVPKGHLRAHEDACQGPFSLNYTNGAAETDGEGIERLWSWLNKAAPSAKEMTQASRHELLDDFCGYTNWRKTLGLCDILARRLLDAIKLAKTQRAEFQAFDARVREHAPEEVDGWEAMLEDWQNDHTQPCPYVSTQPRVTFNAVRLALLHDEERDMQGCGVVAANNTPTSFICLGLEVENLQYDLPVLIVTIHC
ncbi:hypothetical protein BC835DRAFT_1276253, partial [Cytidiella melzeri]